MNSAKLSIYELGMKDPMKSLENNQIWDLFALHSDIRDLSIEWFFRLNKNPDGNTSYKVRLVVKESIDHNDIYALVMKLATHRIFTACIFVYEIYGFKDRVLTW